MKNRFTSTLLISAAIAGLCITSTEMNAREKSDSTAREAFIQPYGATYFLSGIPLNEPVNNKTADIKFQLGLRTRALCSPGGWDLYVAYLQTAVWNAYCTSGPFRDILFRPGIYFRKEVNDNILTAGIEHLSNGRPFFGSPAAAEDYDDGSRGMNYLLFDWKRYWNNDILEIQARAGIGCGVGSYERHNMLFTQDLFLYYLGYFTIEYYHRWNSISAHASLTPLWNKSIANATADVWWQFHKKWPALLLQCHYGYDETLCGCRPEMGPMANIRIGLKYEIIWK